MKNLLIAAVILLVSGSAVCAGAWEPALPTGALEFGGYSDVFFYRFDDEDSSTFALNHFVLDANASLYDNVTVRAEVEWANQRLAPGVIREADADLTFAYVDYALVDEVTLRAGKFLLPFNVYNERLYRADVAKLASPPFINSIMLPVKHSETGIQLYGMLDTGTDIGVDWSAYVVNGLGLGIDDDSDKAVGSRVGVVTPVGFGMGLSGYYMSDMSDDESLTMLGADVCYEFEGLQLRGEYLRSKIDESVDGFYLQAAYAFLDRYEVVARYDEADDIDRTTLGANYKLTEDLTFRLSYEWNDLEDGLTSQLAVRF